MKADTGKNVLISILIGLGAGAVSCFVPGAVYFAPAFIAFAWAAWGLAPGVAATAAAAAASLAFAGMESGLYILGMFLPSAVAIGVLLAGNKPYRSAVCAGALLVALGSYLSMCLPAIIAGNDPFALVRENFAAWGEFFLESAESMLGADATEAVAESFAMADELVPGITVISAGASGMMSGLFSVLIARALVKKTGKETRPMAPFALWQLSRQYTWASFAALVGALAALLASLANADAVFAAAECVVLGPLFLNGICYMDFTIRMVKPRNKGARIIFYVCAALLIPYSIFLLIGLGLLDRFMKTRRNYRAKKSDDTRG